MPTDSKQVFIRNEQGQVWGPMSAATAGMMMTSGQVPGHVEVSVDGVHFAEATQFPEVQAVLQPAPARPLKTPPRQGIHVARGAVPIAGPGAIAASKSPEGLGRQMASFRPKEEAAPAPMPEAFKPLAPELPSELIPEQGQLDNTAVTRLYYLAASQDATGLFTFQTGDSAIELYFRKGNPEHLSSSDPADGIERYLLSQGACTPEQLAAAAAAKDRFGGELVGTLFAQGVLNPGTAFPLLVQRAQQLLHKALIVDAGAFTFANVEIPSHRLMPLGNRWALLFDAARRISGVELRRKLQDCIDLPIMKSGGPVSIPELRLTAHETRALGYIDGVRSLNLLAHAMRADSDHFFRLAFVLRDMEMISFAATKLAPPEPEASKAAESPAPPPPAAAEIPISRSPPKVAAATPPPAAKPAAAPKPAVTAKPAPAAKPAVAAPTAPAAPLNIAEELVKLRELVAKMKGQSYFDMLGVNDKADAAAVKVAYFRQAKVHHPDTIPPDAPPEMAQLKSTLFAAIGEAYRTLSDDKARADYVAELEMGAAAGQKLELAQVFKAEELFTKGSMLVKARKYADSIPLFEEAIKLNPDEGEFYAWHGYARFQSAPDKKAAFSDASREITTALTKNPRCVPAHFFMGNLAKALGDMSGAQKHYKRTVELQPDHIDAQRELRLMANKK